MGELAIPATTTDGATLPAGSLRAWRQSLARALAPHSLAPEREAEDWLCRALGWSRARLYAHLDDSPALPWPAAQWRRRMAGEPREYVWGEAEFYGLRLQVTPATLIPRPDTETLVDAALAALPATPQRVADLGTGSGAIALALAAERPAWDVHASDASPEALRVAQANGAALRLAVHWHRGDWYAALPAGPWDALLSNPPYVAPGDAHLAALAHEPRSALVAAQEGLADLRQLIAGAPARLRAGGWLLLEHGADQGAAVRALLAQAGFVGVETRRDYAGHERVSLGRRP